MCGESDSPQQWLLMEPERARRSSPSVAPWKSSVERLRWNRTVRTKGTTRKTVRPGHGSETGAGGSGPIYDFSRFYQGKKINILYVKYKFYFQNLSCCLIVIKNIKVIKRFQIFITYFYLILKGFWNCNHRFMNWFRFQ